MTRRFVSEVFFTALNSLRVKDITSQGNRNFQEELESKPSCPVRYSLVHQNSHLTGRKYSGPVQSQFMSGLHASKGRNCLQVCLPHNSSVAGWCREVTNLIKCAGQPMLPKTEHPSTWILISAIFKFLTLPTFELLSSVSKSWMEKLAQPPWRDLTRHSRRSGSLLIPPELWP